MEQPRILSILQAILWAVVLSILVRETQGMQYYILQCMARSSVFIMDINILPIIKIDKMHSPIQELPYGQDLYDTRRVLTV